MSSPREEEAWNTERLAVSLALDSLVRRDVAWLAKFLAAFCSMRMAAGKEMVPCCSWSSLVMGRSSDGGSFWRMVARVWCMAGVR